MSASSDKAACRFRCLFFLAFLANLLIMKLTASMTVKMSDESPDLGACEKEAKQSVASFGLTSNWLSAMFAFKVRPLSEGSKTSYKNSALESGEG